MSDVRVESWQELNELLYEGAGEQGLAPFRSTRVFRGMADARYRLVTSLSRLGGPEARELELHILRAFQKYAYRETAEDWTIWHWLALAQHHGLSTRLLDWTYSPLVAMHFATANSDLLECDGVIWALDYDVTNRSLPDRLRVILDEEGSSVFTAAMLGRVIDSLHAFDRLADRPFVALFEPPSLDERIVNQYALFTLVSDPGIHLDDWLRQHPQSYRRIVVPHYLKPEIRDKLDQSNITERVLYPGLDGLTRWLNRYYTPRGGRDRRPMGDVPGEQRV